MLRALLRHCFISFHLVHHLVVLAIDLLLVLVLAWVEFVTASISPGLVVDLPSFAILAFTVVMVNIHTAIGMRNIIWSVEHPLIKIAGLG